MQSHVRTTKKTRTYKQKDVERVGFPEAKILRLFVLDVATSVVFRRGFLRLKKQDGLELLNRRITPTHFGFLKIYRVYPTVVSMF